MPFKPTHVPTSKQWGSPSIEGTVRSYEETFPGAIIPEEIFRFSLMESVYWGKILFLPIHDPLWPD